MSTLKTEELKDLGDKHIAFMSELQTGGFPYDPTKTYNTGVMCLWDDPKGIPSQYVSLTDSNLGNDPRLNPADWEVTNGVRTYDSSITYTVGPGAGDDFALLSDAISHVSGLQRSTCMDVVANTTAGIINIELQSAYVWTEQIKLMGQNLGHVKITSVNAIVSGDDTGWIINNYDAANGWMVPAIYLNNASAITWGIMLDMGHTTKGTDDGVGILSINSSMFILPNCGIKRASYCGMTASNSMIFGMESNFSDNVWYGVDTYGGSNLYLDFATLSNNINGDGLWAQNSNVSLVSAVIENNGTEGVQAWGGTIQVPDATVTGNNSATLPYNQFLATNGGHINGIAIGTVCNPALDVWSLKAQCMSNTIANTPATP